MLIPRRLERRWRDSGLTVDRETYIHQCKDVNERIFLSKMKYYSGLIVDNQSDQRNLFAVVNKWLHVKAERKRQNWRMHLLIFLRRKYLRSGLDLNRERLA